MRKRLAIILSIGMILTAAAQGSSLGVSNAAEEVSYASGGIHIPDDAVKGYGSDGYISIDTNTTYDTKESHEDDLLSDEMQDLIEEADGETADGTVDADTDDSNVGSDASDDKGDSDNASPGDATPQDAEPAMGSGNDEVGEDTDENSIYAPDPNEVGVLGNSYTSYDSRNLGIITSVKDQGAYNTCWAFTATGMAETSMLKQGLATGNASRTTPDYSEMQLAYFTFNSGKTTDPLGLLKGDYNTVGTNGKNYISNGGNPMLASMALASWVGVTNESTVPYSWAYRDLDASFEYSKDVAHLAETRIVPSDINSHPTGSIVNVDYVKNLILTYGAAITGLYFQSSCMGSDGVSYYTPRAYSTSANHAVMIVGWDDNYDKDNFDHYDNKNRKLHPENNGAWLIKNSWGSSNSYFWLSYEDSTLDDVVAYRFESTSQYDNNYQYDGGFGSYTYPIDNGDSVANVFKASAAASEKLSAVSIALADDHVKYSLQIYKNPSTSNPKSGTAMLSSPVTGTTDYAGLQRINLGKTITLNKGDRFSVVFTLWDVNADDADGDHVDIYIDASSTSQYYSYHSSTAAGQSYLIEGGKVEDIYETTFPLDGGGSVTGKGMGICARIKAFTKNDTSRNNNTPTESYKTIKSSYATVYAGVDYKDVYDYNYYVGKYGDLWKAFGTNDAAALKHFVNYGMKEGRQAKSTFNYYSYKLAYVDLRNAFGEDNKKYYLHYINYGKREGRKATGTTKRVGTVTKYNGVDYSGLFDADYYFNHNGDIANAFGTNDDISALKHFINYGMKEGRQASSTFSVYSYAYAYPDLRRAFKNDLTKYYTHYMNYGKREGRRATGVTTMQGCAVSYGGTNYSLVYDYNYYVSKNADVKRVFGLDDEATLKHFVNYGMKEGRLSKSTFNVNIYKNRYADLRKAFGSDMKNYYLHYIKYGSKEGRKAY